jgi:hypothetical protein
VLYPRFEKIESVDGIVTTKIFLSESCAICLEEMFPEKNTILNCGHTFHEECVKKCVKCPLCRMKIMHPINRENQLICTIESN